ncbi:PREDICTED: epithelial-stromal interaction protein 1 [Gavialis gangeticus]|uniref:epithelial-stromal interaction protein 1 n=1 Tax=Gavialis gangeticus TaxID=94835 RepID=UPI00092E74E2|nr:PREDICTED: epithelial-stromal interaction protein 1 [Gavialis gangeticus]
MYGAGGRGEGSKRRAAAFSANSFSRGYQEWDIDKETEGAENTQSQLTSAEEPQGQTSCSQKQQEQYCNAYVLVPPNETRRNELQRIAKKELEDLERWKEQHRSGPINLTPQRLGGRISEAEVRQKQQINLMQSKYQQKLKREEYARIKREAEEAEIQKKKAIQREKAEKLEEKRRQEEQERREMFYEDQRLKTNELLNRLDLRLPERNSCQIANRGPESTAWGRSHSYRETQKEIENRRLQQMREEQQCKSELLEVKRKQEEEERTKVHQNEHRRVNNAFLDRLQNQNQVRGTYQSGYFGSMDHFVGDSWESRYFE